MAHRDHRLLAGFSAVALLATPSYASAATYYVCGEATACNTGAGSGWADGDDARTASEATSRTSPWKTIDHAEENVAPGDTLIVGDGVYNTRSDEDPNFVLFMTNSGAPDNPITYRAENKWGAVIDGNGVMTSGVWFHCASTPPTSHIRVEDFDVRNFGHSGVYARDSDGAP